MIELFIQNGCVRCGESEWPGSVPGPRAGILSATPLSPADCRAGCSARRSQAEQPRSRAAADKRGRVGPQATQRRPGQAVLRWQRIVGTEHDPVGADALAEILEVFR